MVSLIDRRRRGWAKGLLLLCLAGCYDAPRTNPFDPALTPAVELLVVTVDSTSGSATLEWMPYEGKQPFAEYRVLRQVPGLEAVDTVAAITDVRQTAFRDTTLRPDVPYGYWVEVVNQGGFEVESEKQEGVVYALPPVKLLEAKFSSDTATTFLVWNQYRGPNFTGYEVHQKAPGLDEVVVKELSESSDTTYTDRLLDGNTEYTYHIVVRTGWEGVGVLSNEKSGRFYPFDRSFVLPTVTDAEPQAVGLAVDEQDQLYIAMTMISTAPISGGLKAMERGVWVRFPDIGLQSFFSTLRPSPTSPIQVVVGQGRVYGSVGLENDTALVWASDTEGQIVWVDSVDTGGAFPVGLYLEANGDVVMVDVKGWLYRFSPEAENADQLEGPSPAFRRVLVDFLALPLGQVVVGTGLGFRGSDLFFLLAPAQRDHHILARTRSSSGVFQETDLIDIDQGVGPEKGQILNPIALAVDYQRLRLLVLEEQGRVQAFDAGPDLKQRYITQWGRFGTGAGEFLFAPPTSGAVVVDSQGMIYVADGSGRIQVFAPYP